MALAVMAADQLLVKLFIVMSYFGISIIYLYSFTYRGVCSILGILPHPPHQDLGLQISMTN